VVLVQESETFALISLRGKLRIEDIGKLLENMGRGDKDGEEGKPLLPDNMRAVIRI
jgi:hypothetical protein